MSKSNAFGSDFLGLIFNGVAIADLAENDSASPAASLHVSLHTADPGEAGDQSSNEASYAGYARAAVERSVAGWTVSGSTAVNAALVEFPPCSGGAATVTHFGIGMAASGAGKLLYIGPLDDPLAVSLNIQPQFAAGALEVTEN